MILIADQQKAIRLPLAKIRRLARAVLAGEGVGDRSVSLAFVDNERIRDVNRRFLRHNFATDVLSFLLEDEIDRVFGELVISTEFAAAEAKKRGLAVQQEVLRYVAHGILHLLGYDDATPAKKRVMWKRQEAYLKGVRAT